MDNLLRPETEDDSAFAIDVRRELSRALCRSIRESRIVPGDDDGIRRFDPKKFGVDLM